MAKNSAKLLAGAGALAVIFGGYYMLKEYNIREETRAAEEEAYRETVAEVAADSVSELSFEIDGATTSFQKEDGAWKLEGDDTFPVNEQKMTEVLSYLDPLQVEQTISDAEEIDQYGLEEPQNVLTVKSGDGAVTTVAIGDTNSGTGDAYMMLNDEEDTVYTILTGFGEALSGGLYDYASGETLPVMLAEYIVGVEVERETDSYYLQKEDGVWTLDGSGTELDQDAVKSVVSDLGYISFSGFIAHNCEDASAYGINEDSVRLTIHYDESARTQAESGGTEEETAESAASESEIVESSESESGDEETDSVKKETVVLLIGDTDEAGNYYVQQEGSKEVHTISAETLVELLQADLAAWEAQE